MQEPGPFDRTIRTDTSPGRDRTATIIVAAGIVLGLFMLLLVLPPISILDDDGDSSGASGPVRAIARDELPPAPPGLEAVSALYDLESSEPVDRAATIGVPLNAEQSANEQLLLYTYAGDSWQEIGVATVVAEGNAASGEVDPLPSNVAVFKRGEAQRQVFGYLPSGATVDETLIGALTTLNAGGYVVADDGSIGGELTDLPDQLAIPVVPVIVADDPGQLGALLSTEEGRATHVDAIAELTQGNDYAGMELDYRALDPQDSDDFTLFIQDLADRLDEGGRTLSLVLPAPLRDGTTWDTRGFDVDGLGPVVDTFKVTPDSAPGTRYATLQDAVAFLAPKVGAAKLILEIDSLGREQSSEGVRVLNVTGALTLASTVVLEGEVPVEPGTEVQLHGQNLSDQYGASGLRWDDSAKAVTFGYTGGGGQRTVWIANTFSEAYKLEIARVQQLGGVAIENVSTDASDAAIATLVASYAAGEELALVTPNGQLLVPSWSADAGVIEPATGPDVVWRAPDEPGEQIVTLIVSDGRMRLGQEARITVGP